MSNIIRQAVRLSIPVMAGYIFLGIAFGILCQKEGLGWIWAFFISFSVYAGSMQFVLLSFFHGGFQLFEVIFVTLSVNARQLFYGLSFLQKFKGMGWKKWYMIFSLTDETYSLLCSMPLHEAVNEKNLMFCISLCNQLYWILGSVAGALLGSVIPFDTTGIDFAMTALFVVILLEQCLCATSHIQAYIAMFTAIFCILVFQDNFLLPSLIVISLILYSMQPYVEGWGDDHDAS